MTVKVSLLRNSMILNDGVKVKYLFEIPMAAKVVQYK